jgi:HEAT repeat protein
VQKSHTKVLLLFFFRSYDRAAEGPIRPPFDEVGDDWDVRGAAAESAGRLGLPELAAPLSRLLDDEVWTVRYAAANALRSFGRPGELLLREIAASEVSRSQRTASLILAEGPAA